MKAKKTRSQRPLAALNRDRWLSLVENPSQYDYLRSASGKATQTRFLTDIAILMDYLVSDMCYVTKKVGNATKNGFVLRTWQTAARKTGLPEWRVKQCFGYVKEKGWVTSVQPRGTNSKGDYYGLASIKRVTDKYFSDLGLLGAYKQAKAAAKKSIKKLSKATGVKVRYLLTPLTLLQKFRKRKSVFSSPKINYYAAVKDDCSDIPY